MSVLRRWADGFPKILRHRWTRMACEIVFWRAVSTALSFVGTAWAVRCLGPENLGVSGMVLAISANMVFLISLQMNGAFVRLFKETRDPAGAEHLAHCLTSFRFFAALAACGLIGAGLLVAGLPPVWRLASLAAMPFVVFSAIDASWVLQARENLPLQQRIATLRNFLTAAAYFAFFRPGIEPGWDVVLAATVTALTAAIGWRAAFGRWRGIVSWRNAIDCLPYLRRSSRQAVSATAGWVCYSVQMPLIGWLGSLREVGLVRSANQLAMPFERTCRMLNAMIFPRFVQWRTEAPDKVRRVQFAVVGGSLGAAVVLGGVGALVFQWLLPLVLGAEFKEAAIPCAILLASKCVMVADENLVMSFWAQHRDGEVTLMLAAMAIVGAALLWWLVPAFGARGAAWALLAHEVIATCWLLHRRWITSREDAMSLAVSVPVRGIKP